METKNVYYKVYATIDLPVVLLTYSYRDFNNTIKIDNLPLSFNNGHEFNIEKMKHVERMYGKHFMFWNNSDEAEKYWKENKIKFVYNYIGK